MSISRLTGFGPTHCYAANSGTLPAKRRAPRNTDVIRPQYKVCHRCPTLRSLCTSELAHQSITSATIRRLGYGLFRTSLCQRLSTGCTDIQFRPSSRSLDRGGAHSRACGPGHRSRSIPNHCSIDGPCIQYPSSSMPGRITGKVDRAAIDSKLFEYVLAKTQHMSVSPAATASVQRIVMCRLNWQLGLRQCIVSRPNVR